MLLSKRTSGLRQRVDPLADALRPSQARWPDALPHVTTGPFFLFRLVRRGVQRPGRRAEGQVSRVVSMNHACALAAHLSSCAFSLRPHVARAADVPKGTFCSPQASEVYSKWDQSNLH
jgi:hypothetical protein